MRGSALREFVFVLSTVLIGIVSAIVLFQYVLLPLVGLPGDLDRIAKLGARLEDTGAAGTRVEIVSNSVGVEGIAARFVAQELGEGYQVRNQSANGLDILSGRIYISKVLASDPGVLVWIVRPEMMGSPKQINPEVGAVMRGFGFVDDSPWIETEGLDSSIDQETLDIFAASDFENQISFRTFPLRSLNDAARSRLRRGILRAKPFDTDEPYQIEAEIRGDKLTRHINDVTASYRERVVDGSDQGVVLIERTIVQIQGHDTIPVLVLAPTHPDATEFVDADRVFRDAMMGVQQRTGAIVIDLMGSLVADDYSDAIHPNRQGAEAMSRMLGAELREKLDSMEQDR